MDRISEETALSALNLQGKEFIKRTTMWITCNRGIQNRKCLFVVDGIHWLIYLQRKLKANQAAWRGFVLLPTGYIVRGKVMFWHVSVRRSIHLSVHTWVQVGGVSLPDLARGGTPMGGSPMGGVPHLRSPPVGPGWGVVPRQGGVPHLGYSPPPLLDLTGGVPHLE